MDINIPRLRDEVDLIFDAFKHGSHVVTAEARISSSGAVEYTPVSGEDAGTGLRSNAEWYQNAGERFVDPRLLEMAFAEHMKGAPPVRHKPTAMGLSVFVG